MKLRYTLQALADLENILEYIAAQSPSASRKVAERLRSLAELARQHPQIGRVTDEPGIRRIVARPYPYLVFYEATPDAIVVHAIRHAARNPQGMPGLSEEGDRS
jgi:toxin ParE1/3/4